MLIASRLADETQAAITLWLEALGHNLVTQLDGAERLVVDYHHLQNLNTSTCPIAPHRWLLVDSQLTITQSIRALQLGCGYITTAPLQKHTIENWLADEYPLPNMLALDGSSLDQTPATDPYLDAFIDIVSQGLWSESQQQQAKALIPLRNIALQQRPFNDLQQEGKLTPLEQAQLACHTLAGAALLQQNQQQDAAQIAAQHHEHFDGTGYPQQLKGEAIHPIARLAKLYDAYSGLRKTKAYAKAVSHDTAIQKLQFGDGYLWPTQFDPQLLSNLISCQSNIKMLFE